MYKGLCIVETAVLAEYLESLNKMKTLLNVYSPVVTEKIYSHCKWLRSTLMVKLLWEFLLVKYSFCFGSSIFHSVYLKAKLSFKIE